MRPIRLVWALLIFFVTPLSAQTTNSDPAILTVYTYDSFASERGPGQKVEAAFEQVCECDLVFVTVESATQMLSQIKQQGGAAVADVVLGLDNGLLVEAQNTGLIAPHQVDFSKLDIPVPWTNQNFLPFDFGFFAFVFDTYRTPSPPDSFEQLLLADNDYKIIIQNPHTSTSGLGLVLWVKALYGDQALEVWETLSTKVVAVTDSWSESYGLFLQGEADLVLSYTTSPAYHMIVEDEAKYQAISFTEGHGMQIEVAAILKDAPMPELAQQFMQFIASDSFQQLVPTGNWMYPVIFPRHGLPAEFGELVQPTKSLLIDAQGIADNKSDWIDEFNQAVKH